MEMTAVIAPNQAMALQLKVDTEVHTFDLSVTFRVAIGRHPSNDLQLRSRRVSAHHAEILSEVDGIYVRDMESTNGTYVNEEAVSRKKLSTGDAIRIGEYTVSVLLVPRAEAFPERFPVGAHGSILSFRESRESRESGDATLPELLTELSNRSRSARVAIRFNEEEGRIFLRDGSVIHSEYGTVRSLKALYRLLALAKATYEIQDLPEDTVPQTIQEATDSIVVEGMQQLEALEKLTAKLPPMTHEVALDESCGAPVNTLTADELETYQQLIRHRTVARVLDESAMTDFMVLLLSHGLLQKGFFKAGAAAESVQDATVIKPPQSL